MARRRHHFGYGAQPAALRPRSPSMPPCRLWPRHPSRDPGPGFDGMPHREGQGRRARSDPGRRHRPRRAVRAALGVRRAAFASTRTARWNVDEAEHALHALAEFDLEYAEQPCASVDELAELRRRIKYMGIPIAADESVRKAEDPLAVARAGAADLLVIKAQPLGGVRRALDRSSARRACRPSSRAPSTPRSGSRDGRRRSPRRSPSSTTTAGWARRRCSRPTSRAPHAYPARRRAAGRPRDALTRRSSPLQEASAARRTGGSSA